MHTNSFFAIMFNKHPKRTGIYHIKDNINNLEIRIKLRHVNTLLKLPKQYDLNKILSGSQNSEGVEQEVKVEVIKWQQKLLSSKEVSLYKDYNNCQTEAQKHYHQILKEEEEFRELQHAKRLKTRKKLKKRGQLKGVELNEDKQSGIEGLNGIYTYVQLDNYVPLENQNILQHSKFLENQATEKMFIYAELPDLQLVCLEWNVEKKLLYIYPDFNNFENNPYFIEIDTDYRHLYTYAVENVSKKREFELNHFLQLPELETLQPHWLTEEDLNVQFQMPPRRKKRLSLLFELKSAKEFYISPAFMHVRYYIDLPDDIILEEGILEASSHAAELTPQGSCSWSYVFQIVVLCSDDVQQQNATSALKLYLELLSIDGWQRERLEGYAFYLCPLEAGNDTVQLCCCRPAENWLESLNRRFIGGRKLFDFKKFFNDDSEDALKNRSGCRMQSMGQLELSCQKICQRNCDLLQPCRNRNSGMTLDDIMLAYREARKRLEAIVLK